MLYGSDDTDIYGRLVSVLSRPMYQFNFTSFGSRRGRTSAQMGCLAITPSLMRYLRCRRRTTNSFNANELVKHASFIQYVLYHISQLSRYGPCGGCRVFKLAARFSLLAEFRFLKSSNSPRL